MTVRTHCKGLHEMNDLENDNIIIALRVNGESRSIPVSPRWALADVLREQCGHKGLHIGCEQGVCGACTVDIEGEPVLSCLVLAVEADGAEVRTVESFATRAGELSRLQKAFIDHGAFQCGFCTSGFLVMGQHLIDRKLARTKDSIRTHLSGNVCRCTGYEPIIEAIHFVGSKEET